MYGRDLFVKEILNIGDRVMTVDGMNEEVHEYNV